MLWFMHFPKADIISPGPNLIHFDQKLLDNRPGIVPSRVFPAGSMLRNRAGPEERWQIIVGAPLWEPRR